MGLFLIILFTYVFVIDYLITHAHLLPKIFRWAPEILSGIAFLIVSAQFAKNRILFLPARYVIFFILFILFLAIGVIVNQVQPGAIFSGIRKYFRYAPFFLLPLVFNFSDEDINRLVKVVLFFAFVQLPVVLYQKLVVFKKFQLAMSLKGR